MSPPPLVIGDLRDDEIEAAIALWRGAGLTRPWNDPHADAVLALAAPSSTILAGRLGEMLAATAMGGDFYDFIELPGGRIGLVIADVSGKGVPAAFFMAVARTNLNALAGTSSGPGECLQRTNEVLLSQNPMELFVSVFYAVFDPATGELTYANGGHNPPLLRRANGDIEILSAASETVMGIFEIDFGERVEHLSPGDCLVLYTDGVTEAFDKGGQMYDEHRLLEQVRLHGGGGAQALLAAIFDSVIEFAGSAVQSDDITLAVLKWRPEGQVG